MNALTVLPTRPKHRRRANPRAGAIVAWQRDPLKLDNLWIEHIKAGQTIADIVGMAPELPTRFWKWGQVLLVRMVQRPDGTVDSFEWAVPRENWDAVRPVLDGTITVVMTMPFMKGGGGGGGAKQIGMIIASIALIVLTAGVGAIGIPALGIAGGSWAAMAAAGAIGAIGQLAIKAMAPPPVVAKEPGKVEKDAASVDGAIMSPGDSIAFAGSGTNRIYLQPLAPSFVERINGDEYAYFIGGLSERHAISDVCNAGSTLADVEGFEYAIREGGSGSAPLSLVTKMANTKAIQRKLTSHNVDPENTSIIRAPATSNLPRWERVTTRRNWDEIWFDLDWFSGLYNTDAANYVAGAVIRIRARLRGTTTWRNFPELHLANDTRSPLRKCIRWRRTATEPSFSTSAIPSANGWTIAYGRGAPATGPNVGAWEADAYFSSVPLTSGNPVGMWRNLVSPILHTQLFAEDVDFYLDPAEWPIGEYEVEFKRGYPFFPQYWGKTTYTYNGVIRDMFGYNSAGGQNHLPNDQSRFVHDVMLTRLESVKLATPLPQPDKFATVEVRAKNAAISQVSCLAARYVNDWDGVGWNMPTITSNPAPHFRDALVGVLNPNPLPVALLRNQQVVDWRQECIDQNYTCSTVITGSTIYDWITILVGCGYARLRQADQWGVIYDYDRTALLPEGVFTQANSSGLRWEKPFSELPDAFRGNFRDADLDGEYTDDPPIVYRAGREGGPKIEENTYEGLNNRADVIKRMTIDFRQLTQRATTYSFEADAESVWCERGDLIAIQNDIILKRSSSGRVVSKIVVGTNIVGFVLDSEIEIEAGGIDWLGVPNWLAMPDWLGGGASTGLLVRRRRVNGDPGDVYSVHSVASAVGNVVTLVTPISDDVAIDKDCMWWSGPAGQEMIRAIVDDIQYSGDMQATVSAVPEAPGILMGNTLPPDGYSFLSGETDDGGNQTLYGLDGAGLYEALVGLN
ncbi:MAG: hypothetical protein ACAH27_05690 [Xanthobacteraceae bacterium]